MVLLHVLLFVLTIVSTMYIGGPLYSLAIMVILLCHEMGHYIMTKRYGVSATLPYFIPFPYSYFGTLGAVMKMKGPIWNRKALFDIGAAGPLCGFAVALPFIIAGVKMSVIRTGAHHPAFQQLGEPLLFKLVAVLIFGRLDDNVELVLHPFGYAGWVGLLVTGLNLLPIGQLDGGHVVYAIWGEKSRIIFRIFIALLVLLAIFYNPGWLLFALLLLIFGRHHPAPYDTTIDLGTARKIMAWVVLAVFVLSFIPAPFPELNTVNLIRLFRKNRVLRGFGPASKDGLYGLGRLEIQTGYDLGVLESIFVCPASFEDILGISLPEIDVDVFNKPPHTYRTGSNP